MDAIALLKQDHFAVKALFKDFQALGDEAFVQKRKLVAEIIRELSLHTGMEEAALYPYLKQRDEQLAGKVAEALEEHRVAKWELLALEKMEPEDSRYNATMKVLIDSVLHHIEEEESGLLARLREICSEDELMALADALKAARKAAPTHPHPRMPDHPPGNIVLVPVIAALDRSLDRASQTVERGRDLAEAALKRGRRLVERLRRRVAEGADDARRRVIKVGGSVRERAMQTTEGLKEDASRLGRQVQRTAQRTARKAAAPPKKIARGTRRTAGKTARPRKRR